MIYQGRYICWGPPGTGKTTRLKKSVAKILKSYNRPGHLPALVCSLTRAAASEVAARNIGLPPQAIGTLHSHAYRALGSPEIVSGKNISGWNEKYPEFELGGKSKSAIEDVIDLTASSDAFGDKLLSSYDLHRARMTDYRNSENRSLPEFVDAWEQWKLENGLIDFTDMISEAIESIDVAPGDPGVILVDEAQDMSALEFSLLEKWAKEADAIILFGDPYQSLYVWRGAHPEVFMAEDAQTEVLSQSYRIPRSVHTHAMALIKTLSDYKPIEYQPTESEGETSSCMATYVKPSLLLQGIFDTMEDPERTMMICASCSYMLDNVRKMLIAEAIPFANPWRVTRGDWNPFGARRGVSSIRRLAAFLAPLMRAQDLDPSANEDSFNFGQNAQPLPWTDHELALWVHMIKASGYLNHGIKSSITETGKLETSHDTRSDVLPMFGMQHHEFLGSMLDGSASIEDAVDWIERAMAAKFIKSTMFARRVICVRGCAVLEKPPRIFIGTIHSFKGAEADDVYVFPDLSRIGFQEWLLGDKNRDAIVRMFYVAMTRARQRLFLCRPTSSMSVNLQGA